MTAPTLTRGWCGYSREPRPAAPAPAIPPFLPVPPNSHPHHLDDDPFPPLPVELSVENLLPRAEIELPGGDRQHDLMPHDRALQVRVCVVFAGLVMPVRQRGRREPFEPLL